MSYQAMRNTSVFVSVISVLFLFSILFVHADQGGIPHAATNHIPVCPGAASASSVRCHAHVVADEHGNPRVASSAAIAGYGPVQFQTAYGATTTPSSTWVWNGQTVAVVIAYDNPMAENDLNVYSAAFGLPQCTTANGCFKKVSQTGGTKYPRANQGWALESSMDVQTVHAMCPQCKILLVEAKDNSFANLLVAIDYATANANVVSNSWGAGEFPQQTTAAYDGHFNRPGVAITFSTGDNGYGVSYPASSRYVTAVGGTTLTLNPDGSRASEVAWSGSGSGCSAYSLKPVWQTDTGCAKRAVADVAAVADPATGAAVYDSYGYYGKKGWFVVGGTSLSAPIIAGIYALAGNALSTVHGSYPYAHTSGLFDITSGSTGSCAGSYLCTATLSYDGPTGLGVPNGVSAF